MTTLIVALFSQVFCFNRVYMYIITHSPMVNCAHIKKIIILADSDDNCTDNYMGDGD